MKQDKGRSIACKCGGISVRIPDMQCNRINIGQKKDYFLCQCGTCDTWFRYYPSTGKITMGIHQADRKHVEDYVKAKYERRQFKLFGLPTSEDENCYGPRLIAAAGA